MGDQQFFLKWNDFQTNMVTSFRHLRDEKSFTDENPSKHPIIILKDVSYLHLQAILEFMYAGEVNVKGLAEPPPQMPSIKREG
ncbi:unnamed protein product [Chilo suppressalis]|uniref:BTB domain-containing protein n=1 Tax=Chilo suppressalis TaxID=168631 RepID=A0ABN8B5P4_CHISP|nr:unnamed protein product [Chilo suppressalis]